MTTEIMKINVSNNGLIEDVQKDFSEIFPYLRLQFLAAAKPVAGVKYVHQNRNLKPPVKFGDLNSSLDGGFVELDDNTTVRQLENIFRNNFGIRAQVLRKSGNIWMEASITGDWTLAQQNEHGREISFANE